MRLWFRVIMRVLGRFVSFGCYGALTVGTLGLCCGMVSGAVLGFFTAAGGVSLNATALNVFALIGSLIGAGIGSASGAVVGAITGLLVFGWAGVVLAKRSDFNAFEFNKKLTRIVAAGSAMGTFFGMTCIPFTVYLADWTWDAVFQRSLQPPYFPIYIAGVIISFILGVTISTVLVVNDTRKM